MTALLISGIVLVGLAADVSTTPSAAAEIREAAASQPEATPAADSTLHLADPPELKAAHAAKLQSLREIAGAASEPMDLTAAHLAIANWLLAVPTARPATRWLLGLDQGPDRQVIAESAAAAREHLAEARRLLSSSDTGDKENRKKRRLQLELAADVIEPFAELFAAAGLTNDPQRQQSACSDAALNLAVAREADDKSIAACALLWQSFAWVSAGRSQRALISLPDALTPPESLPYDFLSRLLRCRILADGGQHAAASALLISIQGYCRSWFPGEQPDAIEARRRLAAVLQCRIGQVWLAQIEASGSAAAQGLEDMLGRVRQGLPSDTGLLDVYHLESAIPMILEPPTITQPAPASVPASTSSPARFPFNP